MLKDLNYLDNNAQVVPQHKENVSDNKTSLYRKQSSSANQFIRANKCVKIRISNSMEIKIMIMLLIGKQDGNGTKSSRDTCRILRLRRPHHGRIPHGKIGIHGGGILQSLTKSIEWLFFLACSFGLLESSTDNSTGVVHRIHTSGVHHEHCSRVIFVRMKIVGHLVSHVISLLVSTSPSLSQSTTTRSTTWTARPSPRRHCTPSTSSKTCTVDKQRWWTALARQLREWRKPVQYLSPQ